MATVRVFPGLCVFQNLVVPVSVIAGQRVLAGDFNPSIPSIVEDLRARQMENAAWVIIYSGCRWRKMSTRQGIAVLTCQTRASGSAIAFGASSFITSVLNSTHVKLKAALCLANIAAMGAYPSL